jgi:hypothetical protein
MTTTATRKKTKSTSKRRYGTVASRQAAQDRKDAALAKLADGISALTETAEWTEYLRVQARFRRYSFMNTMLIRLQRPGATRVMPFGNREGTTGWKSLGRNVKGPDSETGEKQTAIWIRKPTNRKVTRTDEQTGEDTESRELWFVWVPVFDVAQTEGEPLTEICHPLDGDDQGRTDVLAAWVRAQGWTVQFIPSIEGGPDGDCDHDRKRIRIATCGLSPAGETVAYSPAQLLASLTHEVAHMILHPNTAQYVLHQGECELEAESVSFVVSEALGIDATGFSFGYVAGWQNGDAGKTAETIKDCGKRISDTARKILDIIDPQEEQED